MKTSSQAGMITVDFLFAFVLVMGFSAILFALSLSLTVAEITQYITFSAARNYLAGNLTIEQQERAAIAKYRGLLGHPVLKRLYTNGWFEVMNDPEVGDISQVIPAYQQGAGSPNKFWGVGTLFTARMLEFQIPFYGSTASEGDGSGKGFQTFLGSYLGRETTTVECLNFTKARWRAIRALQVPSGAADYATSTKEQGYLSYDDNGC